jgi:hypothetical protein
MSLLLGSLWVSGSPVCVLLSPVGPPALLVLGKVLAFLLNPMLFKSVTPLLLLLATPWLNGVTGDGLRGSCSCCCCCCLCSSCWRSF